MSQEDQGLIVFGPGGQIRNVEQNKMLLDELPKTPVLSPEELLRLAKFYEAYPTGVPLGNHLALLALATRDGERVLRKVFTEYSNPGDPAEDIAEGTRMYREPPEEDTVLLSVRRTLFSGIGLLIETLDFETDSGTKSLHYVIAVSPPLDRLPDVSPLRVYPQTSKMRKG